MSVGGVPDVPADPGIQAKVGGGGAEVALVSIAPRTGGKGDGLHQERGTGGGRLDGEGDEPTLTHIFPTYGAPKKDEVPGGGLDTGPINGTGGKGRCKGAADLRRRI